MAMMTKEGYRRHMKFQVCDVERPLGSVSQFCQNGNSVVFNSTGDPRGSYIEHQETGEIMYLDVKGGVYVLNTKVAPRKLQTHPFGGQGK